MTEKKKSLPSLLFLYTLLFPYVINAMVFFLEVFSPPLRKQSTTDNGPRVFFNRWIRKKKKLSCTMRSDSLSKAEVAFPKQQLLLRSRDPYDIPLVIADLVGGFNPFEKYARQIGSFPQIGVKIKNI